MTNFDVMKKTLMKRIDELSKEQLYTLISIIEEINQDYSSVFTNQLFNCSLCKGMNNNLCIADENDKKFFLEYAKDSEKYKTEYISKDSKCDCKKQFMQYCDITSKI